MIWLNFEEKNGRKTYVLGRGERASGEKCKKLINFDFRSILVNTEK
jgi:hypothetical protein